MAFEDQLYRRTRPQLSYPNTSSLREGLASNTAKQTRSRPLILPVKLHLAHEPVRAACFCEELPFTPR